MPQHRLLALTVAPTLKFWHASSVSRFGNRPTDEQIQHVDGTTASSIGGLQPRNCQGSGRPHAFFGYFIDRAHRQRDAVAAIRRAGGWVYYGFELACGLVVRRQGCSAR